MDASIQFKDKWNFHNCLGALYGKPTVVHIISIRKSVFLMGLVDANSKFLYVDMGCNGRVSDGGVF